MVAKRHSDVKSYDMRCLRFLGNFKGLRVVEPLMYLGALVWLALLRRSLGPHLGVDPLDVGLHTRCELRRKDGISDARNFRTE